jgi:hypothetical protein
VQKKALPAFLSVMIEQYFTGQWAKAKTAARLELQCNANRRAQATGRRKGGALDAAKVNWGQWRMQDENQGGLKQWRC